MLRFKLAAPILAAAGMAALLSAGAPKASAEVKLNMVYPFPDFLIYTKQCKQLAADITEAAKGKLSIEVLPFNSIKMFQQPPAVRKGRVDMMCTPYAFFAHGRCRRTRRYRPRPRTRRRCAPTAGSPCWTSSSRSISG